ncbi:MAG: zinc ribbon domain-containing protein [Acidobacteriota bacterium]|nr:zinc ribbon domain-containing protein [Acidobacteriota bacterium]
MAAFCGGCGKPLDGARFCPFCGADSSAATPGVAVPPASPPAPVQAAAPAGYTATAAAVAPKKSSNTLLIVLLIVVVLFGAMGAALMYAAYWAKNRVTRAAKEYGVELPSNAHGRSRRASAAAHRDPCSFLTPTEMAEATAVAITEAHAEEHACNFASADGTGAGAVLEFEWGDGKILMTATKAGGKLMTMAPGTELQTVVGVGDEAYFQNGMLTVRNGDDGFRIMLPAELLTRNLASGRKTPQETFAEMRDIEKGLAQKVLSRM